jgi:uncharacterized repeat protein (TIGR02543 family)
MRVPTHARLFTTAVLTCASAFAGCGGSGGADPTNPGSPAGITYSVSPNTLVLAPGQSGTVVFTVTRNPDFQGEINLGLGGLFGDVTGIFNPPTLVHGATSTTLTITAGTGGGNFGTMSLELDPSIGGKHVNLNGTNPTLSVTVSIKPTVVVNKAGTGTGTITSNPAGINCGSTCSAMFLFAPVTLTATPAAGSTFTGWTGSCTGTSPTCSFTPRVVNNANFNFTTATFTATP